MIVILGCFLTEFRCDCVRFMFLKEFEGIHLNLDELGHAIEKNNFLNFLGKGLSGALPLEPKFFYVV